MKQNSRYLISSIVLLILSYFLRNKFYTISVFFATKETIRFHNIEDLPYFLLPVIIFIFSLSIIPALILLVKVLKNLDCKRTNFAGSLIVISGLVFYVLRIFYIRWKIANLNDLMRRAELAMGANFERIRFEDMQYELYLLAGLVFGTLLCFVIFKKKII